MSLQPEDVPAEETLPRRSSVAVGDLSAASAPAGPGRSAATGTVEKLTPEERRRISEKKAKLRVMVVLSTLFLFLELGTGVYTRSIALIADAFHMFSDVLSLVISLYAIDISLRSPDSLMSYGWSRGEVLAGLVNGVFLVALCCSIVISALERFVEPQSIRDPVLLLSVASAGLAFNLIGLVVVGHHHNHGHDHGDENGGRAVEDAPTGARSPSTASSVAFPDAASSTSVDPEDGPRGCAHGHSRSHLHSHSHGSGEHGHDMNIRGILLHVFGDALGSVAAIVNGLVIWLSDSPDRFICDPITSIFISIVIGVHTIPLVRSTIRIMMMGSPKDVSVEILRRQIMSLSTILDVHDLHVWQLDERRFVGTVHLLIDKVANYDDVSRAVQIVFHQHGIHNVTIQPEFLAVADFVSPGTGQMPSCLLRCSDSACEPFLLPKHK